MAGVFIGGVATLDSLEYTRFDGLVTYPGDTKILVKSSKGRSGPTLNGHKQTTKTSTTI